MNDYEMLRDYLSKVSGQYDEVEDFLSKAQKRMFLKRLEEIFVL